jgi:hypothetical protein
VAVRTLPNAVEMAGTPLSATFPDDRQVELPATAYVVEVDAFTPTKMHRELPIARSPLGSWMTQVAPPMLALVAATSK